MKGTAVWIFGFFTMLMFVSSTAFLYPTKTIGAELPEGIEEQISFSMSPLTPGPNENTTITIKSYSTNLSGADISWFVNGVLAVRNLGATSFTFKTGNIGTRTTIDVNIVKSNGGFIAKTYTIVPAEIDLIFEADTYVPPFYEGRAIFTHESPYHIVAIPNFVSVSGKKYAPSELVYTWKIDGRANLSADGYGRNIMYGVGNLISRPFYVTVKAETPDGSISAVKSIFIGPSEAELFLYEDNPIYGVMYEKALINSYPLDRSEITVEAVPYFFGVADPSDADLGYTWRIGNDKIELPPNENSITLIKNEDQASETMVSVFLRSVNKILQESSGSFTLTFNQDQENE